MIALPLACAAFLAAVSAQSIPATADATALATVKGQFANSGLATPIGNSLALGQQLNPQALLTVVYGSTTVSNGAALTQAQVASQPRIYVTPTAAVPSGTLFTLMLADFAAIGNPDPQLEYRHYLANGVAATTGSSASNLTFVPTAGTVITAYAGPGPAAGEGAHRYAWLMFQQPTSGFTPPANLSTAGTAPGHWNLPAYISATNLGAPIAASFFTVSNGVASFSAQSTSAFAATSSAAGAASSGAAGAGATSNGAAAASGTIGAASAAATTKASTAGSTTVNAAASLFALALAFVALA